MTPRACISRTCFSMTLDGNIGFFSKKRWVYIPKDNNPQSSSLAHLRRITGDFFILAARLISKATRLTNTHGSFLASIVFITSLRLVSPNPLNGIFFPATRLSFRATTSALVVRSVVVGFLVRITLVGFFGKGAAIRPFFFVSVAR